jgi:hypothetical protein
LIALLAVLPFASVRAAGDTYYVSTSGSDGNNGTTELTPFQTLGHVNSLDLEPGDRVLFKCGDVWHGEQLVVDDSGVTGNPITFGSYPEDCVDKPVFSGSLPITGWTLELGNVYVADLSTGDNAGNFPHGINQLFRSGQRLTMGRWPNLDAGAGGYAFVEGHSAGSNQITDDQLPSGVNWTGAIVHIKNIRWSMLDRRITGSSGHTLTLNEGLSCLISGWTNCVDWGYFINNHRQTLDQDGEWYYDSGANRVYVYSASGTPSDVEGSVVLEEATTLRHGGIMLSDGSATSHVVIDNVAIENWFNHGIGTPGGMSGDIYHHITVRDVMIKDVDAAGVRLSSWLERPSNGRKGLRGGHHMVFSNNVIDGANHFGITGYFAESTFEDNEIKNVALIQNLNKSGMGCGLTSSQCTENGDGLRIRTYNPLDSGYGNTLRYNRFEKIGYNGVDVFGHDTILEKNVIVRSCYSKADCGGVRTFGSDNLSTTDVYNVQLLDNIIVDIPGNVDGCHYSRAAFGMGLYVDHYSRDVEARGNTIISTTITGINYQRSTGQIVDNTIYNASYGTEYAAHISLGKSETRATLSGNVMYGLGNQAWTLYAYSLSNVVASDNNYIFHPYVEKHVAYGPSWTRYSFPGWQSFSGRDTHSTPNWFTLNPGDPPLSRVFYNDTKSPQVVDLGVRKYLDLDQNTVMGAITLQPFESVVLIDDGYAVLTIQSMWPTFWGADEADDFTLTVYGSLFTEDSVVRWDGVDLPTGFVNSAVLTAAVSSSQVSTPGIVEVIVHDESGVPGGPDAGPLIFEVVASVSRRYVPLVLR